MLSNHLRKSQHKPKLLWALIPFGFWRISPAWLQIFQSRLDLAHLLFVFLLLFVGLVLGLFQFLFIWGFFELYFYVWTSLLIWVEQSLTVIIYFVQCWHHDRDLYTQSKLMKSRRIACSAWWRKTSAFTSPWSIRTLLFTDSHTNLVIVCGMFWIYLFLIPTKEINALPPVCLLLLHPVR